MNSRDGNQTHFSSETLDVVGLELGFDFVFFSYLCHPGRDIVFLNLLPR